MLKALGVLMIAVTIAACSSSSAPEPLPDESCMGGAVVAAPGVAELVVGDSVLVVARRLSFIDSCFPGAGSSFQWQSQRPDLVEVLVVNDSTVWLRALGPGNFLVFGTLGGGPVPGPLSVLVSMRIR